MDEKQPAKDLFSRVRELLETDRRRSAEDADPDGRERLHADLVTLR